MSTQYKVYFTPRNGRTSYGEEIDISDLVKMDGIPTIKRSIDATDFEFGVYAYDDIVLVCMNIDGVFNDEQDSRSIFNFGRDKTKVRVLFTNSDGDNIVFRGYINEEATKLRPRTDEIELRVLSRDSVLRTSKVASGSVSVGDTITTCIFNILSNSDVSEYLNVDIANINPDFGDTVIDTTDDLTDQSVKDVINRLLLASNSVLVVDSSDNIIVRSRDHNTDTPVLILNGPFDLKQRTNIEDITQYNSGRQRAFTSVMINDTEYGDIGYAFDYGYRQKKIELNFITDQTSETLIARRLVETFKVPKIELEVVVPSKYTAGYGLLDRVSLNYPLRIKPRPGKFLPIVGDTKIGDTEAPLPDTFGSLQISSNILFKIIAINENPKDFTTLLKLRQAGIYTDDGFLSSQPSCIVGFAVIGDSVICAGGSDCDTFESSPVGAAKIGCTVIAEA